MPTPPHTRKILTTATNWKAGYLEMMQLLAQWEKQELGEAEEAARSDEEEYARVCRGVAAHLRAVMRAGHKKLESTED